MCFTFYKHHTVFFMIILKIILLGFWFIFVPIMMGNRIGRTGKISGEKVLLSYVLGWIRMMAIFQLMALPLIFLYARLTTLVFLWSACILCILSYLIWRNRGNYKSALKSLHKMKTHLLATEVVAVLLIVIQLVGVSVFMSSDADDAFYVSEAVTSDYTDTMFQYMGDTGEPYKQFPTRYVMSPFPIFTATLSRLVCTHPTIVAHTLIPIFFIPMSYMVYYLLLNVLFKGNRKKVSLGLCFISILNIWGNVSVYTAATFLMIRIWQGKAILANIILPFITYFLIRIHKRILLDKEITKTGLLAPMMSACLVSSMGIFLAPILVGTYTLISLIVSNRKIRDFFKILLGCLPNIIYGLWYLLLLKMVSK